MKGILHGVHTLTEGDQFGSGHRDGFFLLSFAQMSREVLTDSVKIREAHRQVYLKDKTCVRFEKVKEPLYLMFPKIASVKYSNKEDVFGYQYACVSTAITRSCTAIMGVTVIN